MLKWLTIFVFNSILFTGVSQTVLWSDDFSSPSNWAMTNTSQPVSWDWNITSDQNLIPDAAPTLLPLETSTAGNGFALIDSRNQPGNQDGDGAINAQITNAIPIDLSLYPNVILKFQHSYRWWHGTRGVRVSGDNGSTWTDFELTDSTDYPVNRVSLNPEFERFNISSIAGGQSQVLIQFYYTDNDYKEWYWVVDDLEIIEQPLDDIEIISDWSIGKYKNGVEYTRIPDFSYDTTYYLGVSIFNSGVNDQNNVKFTADFPWAGLLVSDSIPLLASGDTVDMEIPVVLGMSTYYDGTYTISSVNDTAGGTHSDNNSLVKRFEIVDPMWAFYIMDRLNDYDDSLLSLSSIGNETYFEGAENGVAFASLYQVGEWGEVVAGVEILLGEGCTVGAEIVVSVRDSSGFMNDGIASSIYTYGIDYINQFDINNGNKYIYVPIATLTEGSYYVTVESYNPGESLFLMDDQSYQQPENASLVYTMGDSTFYKDGVAFGIRLIVGPEGLDKLSIPGVKVYPNPTKGTVTISNEHSLNNHIIVTDLVGRLILEANATTEKTVDIASEKSGIYLFYIENEEGEMVRRVMLD